MEKETRLGWVGGGLECGVALLVYSGWLPSGRPLMAGGPCPSYASRTRTYGRSFPWDGTLDTSRGILSSVTGLWEVYLSFTNSLLVLRLRMRMPLVVVRY